MGKRHEGMKTALGGGSQHREQDVNDSRGKGINNAGLPLSLHPSVPLPPSPPLSTLTSATTLLYISPVFFPSTVSAPDLSSLLSSH